MRREAGGAELHAQDTARPEAEAAPGGLAVDEEARARVFLDLVANLHKEQRPDLVPLALGLANARLESGQPPLSAAEARRYYAADKRVWSVFLALRRLDRWLTTRVLRRRYEFLLPGPIRR